MANLLNKLQGLKQGEKLLSDIVHSRDNYKEWDKENLVTSGMGRLTDLLKVPTSRLDEYENNRKNNRFEDITKETKTQNIVRDTATKTEVVINKTYPRNTFGYMLVWLRGDVYKLNLQQSALLLMLPKLQLLGIKTDDLVYIYQYDSKVWGGLLEMLEEHMDFIIQYLLHSDIRVLQGYYEDTLGVTIKGIRESTQPIKGTVVVRNLEVYDELKDIYINTSPSFVELYLSTVQMVESEMEMLERVQGTELEGVYGEERMGEVVTRAEHLIESLKENNLYKYEPYSNIVTTLEKNLTMIVG